MCLIEAHGTSCFPPSQTHFTTIWCRMLQVNQGRVKANHNPRNIGSNVDPVAQKFNPVQPKDVATEV